MTIYIEYTKLKQWHKEYLTNKGILWRSGTTLLEYIPDDIERAKIVFHYEGEQTFSISRYAESYVNFKYIESPEMFIQAVILIKEGRYSE